MRRKPVFAATAATVSVVGFLLAATTRAGEGYHVDGTLHDDFPAIAGKVAILPPKVPEEFDRSRLERNLASQTDLRPKAPLIPLREVQAAIARLGVDPSEPATRGPLAAALGADSFLEIRVSDLATWSSEQGEPGEGTVLKKSRRTDRARARIELRIVSAAEATMWFEGTTHGSMIAKGIDPVLADMLDKLFERAYPARRYR